MISCYLYFLIGACSNVINNFSMYIFSYPIIPGIIFNEKKNASLKGTWNIKGSEDKFDNILLTSLAKIPNDKKCTTENIYYYYYLLGKFVTTQYYLIDIYDDKYNDIIVFNHNNLYTKW